MATSKMDDWGRVAGSRAAVILCVLGLAASAAAQSPGGYSFSLGGIPPGAIGGQPLDGGEPRVGFFQPVEIRAPRGAMISLAEGGRFTTPQPAPLRVALLVGQPYRIGIVNLPLREGLEVYPTIELVDRLHTPRGQETRFPIIVDLATEDLELALDGKFVTRVVYLEDPANTLPVRQDPQTQTWFDVRPGTDPIAEAKRLGRPMAVVRMGARTPDMTAGLDPVFLFGCPPVLPLASPGIQRKPSP